LTGAGPYDRRSTSGYSYPDLLYNGGNKNLEYLSAAYPVGNENPFRIIGEISMMLRSVVSAAVLILYYMASGLIIRQFGYGQPSSESEMRPYQAMPGTRAGRRTRLSRYGIPD
jgi:hypothetical protein